MCPPNVAESAACRRAARRLHSMSSRDPCFSGQQPTFETTDQRVLATEFAAHQESATALLKVSNRHVEVHLSRPFGKALVKVRRANPQNVPRLYFVVCVLSVPACLANLGRTENRDLDAVVVQNLLKRHREFVVVAVNA